MIRVLVWLGSSLLVVVFVMFGLAVGLKSSTFVQYAFLAIFASFFAYIGAGVRQMFENDRNDF